jgi:hypothetical protein
VIIIQDQLNLQNLEIPTSSLDTFHAFIQRCQFLDQRILTCSFKSAVIIDALDFQSLLD